MSEANDLPMSVREHEQAAAGTIARVAILTVSDTRTQETDTSGDRIAALLEEAGHVVVARRLAPDVTAKIASALDKWLLAPPFDTVITTGGTGLSARDRTVRVVRERLLTELPGFGETFRRLSYDAIGPAAMLSRALGGVTGPPYPSALFALPGSVAAVELAMQALIIPTLPHLLRELRKEGY